MYYASASIWALVLIGVAGISGTTAWVLHRGAVAAGMRSAGAIGSAAAIFVAGAIAVSGALAWADAYHQTNGQATPWFGVAFATLLITSLLATRLTPVRRILAQPEAAAWLAWPHAFRFVGGVFLIVMAQGHLPAAFALPAGIGDIATATAAPLVARGAGGRRAALVFNAFGMLDLVVAVVLGSLVGLGPYVAVHVSPTPEPLTLLPLSLIPAGVVPLLMALHIVSIRHIRATPGASGGAAPSTRRSPGDQVVVHTFSTGATELAVRRVNRSRRGVDPVEVRGTTERSEQR